MNDTQNREKLLMQSRTYCMQVLRHLQEIADQFGDHNEKTRAASALAALESSARRRPIGFCQD